MPVDLTRLGTQFMPMFVNNCAVLDLGSGTYPRIITVRLPGIDGGAAQARWHGNRRLEVGDLITCRRDPNDLEVFAIDEAGDALSVLHNYSATTDPGAGDDEADGYSIGSQWLNTVSGAFFVCTDASTGAAVWDQINGSGGGTWPDFGKVKRLRASTAAVEYSTIASAIAAASAGDVLLIGPGTFTETITIGAALTLIGTGQGETIITNSSGNTVTITAAGVVLENLTVTSTSTSDSAIRYSSSGGGTLRRVEVTGSTVGLVNVASSSSTVEMDNCTVTNSYSGGAAVSTQNILTITLTVKGGYYTTNSGTAVSIGSATTANLRGPRLDSAPSGTPAADSYWFDSSGDIHTARDSLGLYKRQFYTGVVEEEFNSDPVTAGSMFWAGSPFAGTPTQVDLSFVPSWSYLGHNTAAVRLFLYRTDNLSALGRFRVILAPIAYPDGMYTGYRIDDGTDNNYVEAAIRKTTGTATMEFITRIRTGGGSATTTVQQTIRDYPTRNFIDFNLTGTAWSSWTASGFLGFNSPGVNAYIFGSGLTWTPSRRGVIFDTTGRTATFQGPIIDKLIVVS